MAYASDDSIRVKSSSGTFVAAYPARMISGLHLVHATSDGSRFLFVGEDGLAVVLDGPRTTVSRFTRRMPPGLGYAGSRLRRGTAAPFARRRR